MRLSWCNSCGQGGRPNFGDALSPALLESYGHSVTWAPPALAEVVAVGSVLSKMPAGWGGTVLGTGLIREDQGADMRKAAVRAVRGAMTRHRTRGASSAVLGDPGVLVGDVYRFDPETRPPYELAVPHYVDKALAARHDGAWVGDITGDPAELLRDIAQADIVYTSSLHALIAADALGVPHVLEPHPAVVGGLFKFQDYASAFGMRITPGEPRLTPRDAMLSVQTDLRQIFAAV